MNMSLRLRLEYRIQSLNDYIYQLKKTYVKMKCIIGSFPITTNEEERQYCKYLDN